MNIIESLYWRYAVKKMNGNLISNKKINIVLESIRLCPTSFGMQPFEVIVIENKDIKEKILPIAYHQMQVVDCSHLIVFAFWNALYEERAEEYIHNIQNIRQVEEKSLEEFKNLVFGFLSSKTIQEKTMWAKNQTYIALGMALTVCALERIDSTPMEGFIPEKLDEILSLKNKNLCSSVILALGYRDEQNDRIVHLKKVRRSNKNFFQFLK